MFSSSYNRVKFVFGDSSESLKIKNKFQKMDKTFLDIFTKFCKQVKISEIYITSSWRGDTPKYKGSYHYKGLALDIHYIKFTSGIKYYFTVFNNLHSNNQDDDFFKKISNYFRNYKFEYISPARVYTQSVSRMNTYRNKTSKEKDQARLDSYKLPYQTDRIHLHHLHFAFNPSSVSKIVSNIKKNMKDINFEPVGKVSTMLLFAGGIIVYIKNKKGWKI